MDKPVPSTNPTKKVTYPDDKNLMDIAQYLKDAQGSHKRSIPPLEQWQPKHCGVMDLKVLANGEWWHEGQLIKRQPMIDLFATVLWKENDNFYLKTPVEMIEIETLPDELIEAYVNNNELVAEVEWNTAIETEAASLSNNN